MTPEQEAMIRELEHTLAATPMQIQAVALHDLNRLEDLLCYGLSVYRQRVIESLQGITEAVPLKLLETILQGSNTVVQSVVKQCREESTK